MTEQKRLYRSTTDRRLCGVCGGLAEYFDVDPSIVRLLFVVLFLADGVGLLLYIALCIVMPEKHEVHSSTADNGQKPAENKDKGPEFEPLGSRS